MSANDFLGHFADLQRMRRTQHLDVNVRTKTEVTENRAPTDESVRLLAEMERAAETKLVARLKIDASGFSCSAYVFNDFSQGFGVRLRARFTLGEQLHDIDVELPERFELSKEALVDAIRDAVARAVAVKILRGVVPDLVKLHVFQ